MKMITKTFFLVLFFLLMANVCQTQEAVLSDRDSIISSTPVAVGEYEEAIEFLLEYLECRPPGDTTEHLASIYMNLSGQYRESGKAEIAMAYADSSFKVLEKVPEIPLATLAHAKFQRAVALYEVNQNDLAGPLINSAINLMNESIASGDETGEVLINAYHLNALKIALRNKDISLAKYHAASIKNLSDHENDQWVAESLPYYYAYIEGQLGNWRESIRLNQKYVTDFDESGKGYRALTVAALVGIGTDYNRLKEYETAQYYIKAAIARVDSMEFTTWVHGTKSQGISNLIINSRFTEKRANIDSLLRVAKYHALLMDAKGRRGLGVVYANAALTHSAYGNYERSNELFDSAFLNISLDTNFIGQARLPRIKGNTFVSTRAIKITLNNRQNAYVMEAANGYRDDGLLMAKEAFESYDSLMWYSRSQLSLNTSIGELSRGMQVSLEDGIEVMIKLAQKEQSTEYLTKSWQIASKAKSDILTRHLNGNFWAGIAELPQSTIELKESLENSLTQLEDQLKSGEGDQVLRDEIIQVNDSIKQLNQAILVNYPAFAEAVQGYGIIDPKEASKKLANDELLVEYFIGEDSIYIFTLGKQQALRVAIRALPVDFKATIAKAIKSKETNSLLYDLLIQPFLATVSDRITRLHIIPDGDLWNLPFAALQHDDRFLIQDYAISYAYSAGLLFDEKLRKEVESTRTRFAGFGLSYDAILKEIQTNGTRSPADRNLLSLAGLPYAKDEVVTIGKLTKGNTWLDEAATKEQFLKSIPDHQQLHLAMHGLTDPENPMENALVFAADNSKEKYALLTTREILAQKIPARLAVLSACHTGAGPLESSEGIQSMARAFTFSGVKATLASRWEASDKVTHDILIRFYEELEKGEPLDRAQQIATIAYLDQASPADQRPELWANLALTGFTNPIHGGRSWLLPVLGFLAALVLGLLKFFGRDASVAK